LGAGRLGGKKNEKKSPGGGEAIEKRRICGKPRGKDFKKEKGEAAREKNAPRKKMGGKKKERQGGGKRRPEREKGGEVVKESEKEQKGWKKFGSGERAKKRGLVRGRGKDVNIWEEKNTKANEFSGDQGRKARREEGRSGVSRRGRKVEFLVHAKGGTMVGIKAKKRRRDSFREQRRRRKRRGGRKGGQGGKTGS